MRVLTSRFRGLNRLAFSPDGTRLAAAGNGYGIAVWRLNHDPVPVVLADRGRTVTALHFTPDGRSLLAEGRLFHNAGYGIVQFDTTTGEPLAGGFLADHVLHLLRSAAGDRFACRDTRPINRMVELGPVGGGPAWGVRREIGPLAAAARPLALLSEGRVATAPFTPIPDDWPFYRRTAAWLVPVPAWGSRRVVPFPGDDRAAVLGDGGLGVWRPTMGTVGGPVPFPDGRRLTDLAVTPDGRCLLTAGTDGRARVWNADTLSVRVAYDWQVGGLRACAVAPDGLTAAVATERGMVIVFDLE